jgi:hypothetical protein
MEDIEQAFVHGKGKGKTEVILKSVWDMQLKIFDHFKHQSQR